MGSSHSQSILFIWREAALQGMLPCSPALKEKLAPVLEEMLTIGHMFEQDILLPFPIGSTGLSS